MIICGVFGLIWAAALVYKYVHLGHFDWDLAFFTQACWQLLHGSQYVPLVGINYFGDHSYFITFLILPFFALVPHPLTLVFFKLAAYLASAFLLYKLLRRDLPQWLSVGLMTAYLLLPANCLTVLYEFNPESLAVPFIVLLFDAFERKRWRLFWVSAAALLLIKENFALVTAAFGVYGWVMAKDPRQKYHSGVLVALSAAIFYVLAMVVIPLLRHSSTHAFVVRYSYLGSSLEEILRNLFLKPQMVLEQLFSKDNAKFIAALGGPWILPAILGLPALIVIAPLLLQHLLADYEPEKSIYYHYGLTLAPVLFLAAGRGLAYLKQRIRPAIFVTAVTFIFVLSVVHSALYVPPILKSLDYHQDNLTAKRWEMLREVPPQAGVVATFDYLTPLAMRKELYSFHKIYDPHFQDDQRMQQSELNVRKKFVLPDTVRYAVLDFDDIWLAQVIKDEGTEKVIPRLREFLKGWRLVKSHKSLHVFVR